MLRQEKQSKEVRPSRLAKSPPTPEEGGEKPSRRAPATAHANIQDYSFQTRQFRGRRIKGDGGLTVLLNRSTRPTPVSANLFRTPVSQNFLIMETSTGFGAEDAKLHFTRSLSTAGLGFEKQPLRLERPPAPLLHHCLRCASQSAAPRCPSTRGHLLPDPGRRNPAEAGNRAADTPTHPRPPACALSACRPHPFRFLRHPRHPLAHPSGHLELSPPPPPSPPSPCLRAVLSPNYQCPGAGWVGRPCPGKVAGGR